MTKVGVLILNWNGQQFLEKFLPSLIEYTPNDIAEIIVADNGSSDNSLAWITKQYPQLRTIELHKNHGFAGGYNLAIEKCSHEYILLLNSDIEVSPGWLEPLINAMEVPGIGAVMPKILSFQHKTHFEYAGASGGFLDKYAYPFCRGRIFDELESDMGQYDNSVEIHWTTGACMLVQRETFNQLGGFDTDFFAHMEEIDLCWRIRQSGLKLLVIPKSKVYHVGGGTLSNESPHKLYLNFRNDLFLLYKNLPKGQLFSTVLTRLLLDGLAAVKYLISGKFSFMASIFKAHQSFFGQMSHLKKKRSALIIQQTHKVELYPRSIVLEFFLRAKKKFSDLDYK